MNWEKSFYKNFNFKKMKRPKQSWALVELSVAACGKHSTLYFFKKPALGVTQLAYKFCTKRYSNPHSPQTFYDPKSFASTTATTTTTIESNLITKLFSANFQPKFAPNKVFGFMPPLFLLLQPSYPSHIRGHIL